MRENQSNFLRHVTLSQSLGLKVLSLMNYDIIIYNWFDVELTEIAVKKSIFVSEIVLKEDIFGQIEKGYYYFNNETRCEAIRRVYSKTFWVWPLTRFLANNEKKALKRLESLAEKGYVPALLADDKQGHVRSFIPGDSMHRCTDKITHDFFTECKYLLKAMRKAGVCNNDLAKEANWIISEEHHLPVITDFQLALCFSNRTSKLFFSLARDDLRHLLKHKRKYDRVSAQEKVILNKRSSLNNLWMATGKKLHRIVTRKLLGWEDRVGPEERNI